jgi:DNA-binding ferritin-like protein
MASVTADLEATGGAEISDALRHLLADVFTVFLKTKRLSLAYRRPSFS